MRWPWTKKGWRESPAHLLLLSKFIYPRTETFFTGSEYWDGLLGEPLPKAITRFVDEGLLEYGDIPELVKKFMKVPDLKTELKTRDLATTGKKADLSARLIEADPDGVKRLMQPHMILRCTPIGMDLSRKHIAALEGDRLKAEQDCLEQVIHGHYDTAITIMAGYNSRQVFKPGIGVDWANPPTNRNRRILEFIYSGSPKILQPVTNEALDALRPAAAMMHLCGPNSPTVQSLLGSIGYQFRYDPDTAARMLLFYGAKRLKLEKCWLSTDKVRILTARDRNTCPTCQALDNRTFSANDVPEIPYCECTGEFGCRCEYLPIIDVG